MNYSLIHVVSFCISGKKNFFFFKIDRPQEINESQHARWKYRL